MAGKLFLFEWDEPAAEKRAEALRAAGWSVKVESEDGARGGRRVLDDPPQVVVLDLAQRPSHSRETAAGIRGYKAGRRIPMLFVDGKPEDIEKTRSKVAGALFVDSAHLLECLARMDV